VPGVSAGRCRAGTDRSATRLASLAGRYEPGALTVPAWKQFALAGAALARREIETGHVLGKIALATP
jgi:hypothetical protein